jgi:hypothetical protein
MPAIVSFVTVAGCINGGESNSEAPVVTTPSAAPAASSASPSESVSTNNNLSIMDSSYNLDSMRIDTIRK